VTKLRAAVIGATGYAGAELVRILSGHPHVDLTVITSRQYAGCAYDSIYPALRGFVDAKCLRTAMRPAWQTTPMWFFWPCPTRRPWTWRLPAGGGQACRGPLRRFPVQESHGLRGPLPAPHLRRTCWTYRYTVSANMAGDRLPDADLIGNPGCYPTSVLLPLMPLIREGLVETGAIVR
jgi:N-acetyl-gamma-glutamyl-phosphate reductase